MSHGDSSGLCRSKSVALLVLAGILAIAGPATAGWQTGDLITYSHGDWGGDPTSQFGAALLVNEFNTVYASSGEVIVGSPSAFTMAFTDAPSVLTYLPASGAYAPLNASVVNPITTASGAFGGEVLALQLNVDFSDAGSLVGSSGLRFGDLVLTNFSALPNLNGLTVRQFLGDVNIALGGGSSIDSISDLSPITQDLTTSFSNGQPSQFAEDHLVAPSAPILRCRSRSAVCSWAPACWA